jgi:6-phosphogluconolactonase (cycloisomerase 2 family)
VQAFDNCGGVGKANVTITTTGESQPGGFLYTVNTNAYNYTVNTVYGFTIVPSNGALAPTGQGFVNTNLDPMSVASDAGGFRLYVGDYMSGDVFGYFIDRSNGYIFPVPGAPFPVNYSVTSVKVHPSGDWVFATRSENKAADGVAVLAVQADGSLAEAAGSPYATTQPGPWTMAMDPSGQFLYVGTSAYYGINKYLYVDGFYFDATAGSLSPLAGSPFVFRIPSACGEPTSSAYGMLDVSGHYLYMSDTGIDLISGATVSSSTGRLTEMSKSPWPDEGGCNPPPNEAYNWACPIALAVDGTGKFLYVSNIGPQNISIYSIGANGALNFVKYYVPSSRYCTGNMASDVPGNYLYVVNCDSPAVYQGSNGIAGYAINHTTGDLTPTPGSPYTYPALGNYNNYSTPMALTGNAITPVATDCADRNREALRHAEAWIC